MIELTSDAVQAISKQDSSLLSEEEREANNFNLRFIKPSRTFYNQVMSSWFKFINLLEEQDNQNAPTVSQSLQEFKEFAKSQLIKRDLWYEELDKPLSKYGYIIVQEYFNLKSQSEEDTVSMCSFFDNVKKALLNRWEKDIVQKSSLF
jgi:hypothetical protein